MYTKYSLYIKGIYTEKENVGYGLLIIVFHLFFSFYRKQNNFFKRQHKLTNLIYSLKKKYKNNNSLNTASYNVHTNTEIFNFNLLT